ncbi:MAG: molybdenum cofactor biosynthesis protein MoaE [Verrucomicrobiales bacterium]|nr:molybdenum cofactor biosynthesis protein MoaE [Verrucomicrobiales bacterium]
MASDHFSCSIGKDSVSKVEAGLDSSDIHGADIRFHGVVRKTEDDREISAIRYTFYQDMALQELEKIGADMTIAFPDHRAMVYHRVGEVTVGEASILIRVQTKHSAAAFEICREYLRRIKETVPIWKKPVFV